jgi:hypothetical protein
MGLIRGDRVSGLMSILNRYFAIFALGVLVGYLIFAYTSLGVRYYFQKVDKLMAVYRYDSWTGKAWICGHVEYLELDGCKSLTAAPQLSREARELLEKYKKKRQSK